MEWNPEQTFPDSFHHVAQNVYCDNPNWIPESLPALKNQFGSANPYFETCDAWLSVDPGTARLAGFYNPDLQIKGRKVSFFGFWETMDNTAANKALFSDFEKWAKSKGAELVCGPINFTTYGPNRVRLNAFDEGCFIGEPFNPPYYPAILEELDYRLMTRYFSIIGAPEHNLPCLQEKVSALMDRGKKLGLAFIPLTYWYWKANINKFYELVDCIFSDNFAYSKITFEEFEIMFGNGYAHFLCPHTSVLALDKNQDIAGFLLNFPDYTPLCRQDAKSSLNIKDLCFDKHFHLLESPSLVLKTAGVAPKYRNIGLLTMLYYLSIEWRRPHYVKTMKNATMREDNPSLKMVRTFCMNDDSSIHTYGLFLKNI